jgi:nitrite reductase/ring-hydroxylating ferredoxin subunit
MPPPTRVAAYSRRVLASEERVWENVRDWEHLPWLHRESFASIGLEERGDWGWRARIGLHGGREIQLELVIDGSRYVSRTLAGDGAGSEIWTTVRPARADATDVEVEFHLPGVSADAAPRLGAAYVKLYTLLWDQDEAMMRRRAELLARRGELLAPLPTDQPPLDLGPADALSTRAPFAVEYAGRRYRVVQVNGALRVHSTLCPHWLGPLEAAPEADGSLRCPWHGYRFDLASGRGCDAAARLRLPPTPRLVIGADGRARLAP